MKKITIGIGGVLTILVAVAGILIWKRGRKYSYFHTGIDSK